MPKPPTKSSGIRMPVELYNWIDRRAARRDMNRSQCVCVLLEELGVSTSVMESNIFVYAESIFLHAESREYRPAMFCERERYLTEISSAL